ncbi:hypothetical protein TNCV_733791 [Trichonephila clavipes]|nr:hypothetical protein TNCV_733791 [Trichonephila clavipes]
MKKLLVLVLLACLLCSAIYARESFGKDFKRSFGFFKPLWERHEGDRRWWRFSTSTTTTAAPQNVTN